jgi:transcription antitermination factor NusG
MLTKLLPASTPQSNLWFAIRVKPNFEKTAAVGLECKGLEQFLPTYKQTRKWTDRLKNIESPLFPGYLFCRFDPAVRTPVLSTPGVLYIVRCGQELVSVDEAEIDALRRAWREGLPLEPSPFLKTGQRARVSRGILTGVEGIILDAKNGSRLGLQVSLLQRSVSVEIDRDCLTPIDEPEPHLSKLVSSYPGGRHSFEVKSPACAVR